MLVVEGVLKMIYALTKAGIGIFISGLILINEYSAASKVSLESLLETQGL